MWHYALNSTPGAIDTCGMTEEMNVPEGVIVVGVDWSVESELGVRWAADESQRSGAPLHLLHCLEPQLVEIPPTREEWRIMRANAEQLVKMSREIAVESGACRVTSDIVEMTPAIGLRNAGRSAAMIVLGARGHGIIYRFWLESTSQQVSEHAGCPVLVVRQQTKTAWDRIVVGVDGSPASHRALGFAFQLARRREAPVVAVHA
jgi:nucleotide-binding universal stress UspA family protein